MKSQARHMSDGNAVHCYLLGSEDGKGLSCLCLLLHCRFVHNRSLYFKLKCASRSCLEVKLATRHPCGLDVEIGGDIKRPA